MSSSKVSLTDPDSRAMAAHTKVAVGYNAQVAVDAKNKMIVDQDVIGLPADYRRPSGVNNVSGIMRQGAIQNH
jgi:hypothetical protein